jgi:GNAT superfamily N-acetyltransferase
MPQVTEDAKARGLVLGENGKLYDSKEGRPGTRTDLAPEVFRANSLAQTLSVEAKMTESTLTLRPADASDTDALDRLFGQSYPVLLKPDYPPSVLVTAVPLISKAQPALIASGTFFVVCDGDDIVGAGGWTMQPPGGRPGTRGVGHIRHVVTDHTRTRQGIGRRLVEHLILHAHACGMMQLHCQSTRTAVPFYEALGFIPQADIDIELRPGIVFPAVFMQRNLA